MLCSELIKQLEGIMRVVGDKRVCTWTEEECCDIDEIRYFPTDDEIIIDLKKYEW